MGEGTERPRNGESLQRCPDKIFCLRSTLRQAVLLVIDAGPRCYGAQGAHAPERSRLGTGPFTTRIPRLLFSHGAELCPTRSPETLRAALTGHDVSDHDRYHLAAALGSKQKRASSVSS